MLLEIEYPEHPEANVSEHYDNGPALKRALLVSLHAELEESAEVSPPEAFEAARELGRYEFEDISPDRPWTFDHGRARVRVTYDGERPQAL
jgi:hypothetical protein